MGRGGGVSPTPRVSACSRPGLRCRIDFVHLGSRGWTKERAKLRKPVFKEICISIHVGIAEPLGIEMGTSTQVACTPRQLLCATHTFEPSPETLECVGQARPWGIALRCWFRMMKFCATFLRGHFSAGGSSRFVLALGDSRQDHLAD